MTIRLRCVECHRKLKVPDAARGRKVQCPVCGARFRESSSLPVPTEVELIDALFADTKSSPFSIPEDSDAPEEITIPAAPVPPSAPASPPIPNLELEEPPEEAEPAEFEPLGLEEEDIEEPALVEETVEGEMVEITDEVEDLDAVEVMDEASGELVGLNEEAVVVEEAEPEEEKRSAKKKKRGFLSFLWRKSDS
jgi:hypothetical protein